jgi:hypothetical protein
MQMLLMLLCSLMHCTVMAAANPLRSSYNGREQASKGEVLAELEGMLALQLDGCWRSVDPGYLGNLLELVILRWGGQCEGDWGPAHVGCSGEGQAAAVC